MFLFLMPFEPSLAGIIAIIFFIHKKFFLFKNISYFLLVAQIINSVIVRPLTL